MPINTVPRAAQVRCYKCGSTEVAYLCHHIDCKQPLCRDHAVWPKTDRKGNQLTTEFSDLGLADSYGETPVHCEYCDHIVRKVIISPLIVGWTVFAVGFVTLLVSISQHLNQIFPFGLALTLTGGICGAFGFIFASFRRRKREQGRTRLPVLPTFDNVQILEKMEGVINLDSTGTYQDTITNSAQGWLNATGQIGGPELRELIAKYWKKYDIEGQRNLPFLAGYMVLKGKRSLRFDHSRMNEHNWNDYENGIIPLIGTVEGGAFARSASYTMLPNTADQLPVRLVPSLGRGGSGHELELELQWISPAKKRLINLSLEQIRFLELFVPVSWGEVTDASNQCSSQVVPAPGGAGALRRITWREINIEERKHPEKRRTLWLRFANEINLREQPVVTGRLVALFKDTMSGLEGIDFYSPLGKRQQGKRTDLKTVVVVNLNLSLARLRCEKRAVAQDEREVIQGVNPDYNTVIALVEKISQSGFYVKQVVENPPGVGDHANMINRKWDIKGRDYKGLQPIDFTLVLTGQEDYSTTHELQKASTGFRLSINGVYANPVMQREIERTRETLYRLTTLTLAEIRSSQLQPLLN